MTEILIIIAAFACLSAFLCWRLIASRRSSTQTPTTPVEPRFGRDRNEP